MILTRLAGDEAVVAGGLHGLGEGPAPFLAMMGRKTRRA